MTTNDPIGVTTALARIADHKAKEAAAEAKAREDRYAVIKVDRAYIPVGAKLTECYETDKEWIILGDPPDDEHLPEDQQHNCDAMGCGSLGPHVIARYPKGNKLPNATEAPKQE